MALLLQPSNIIIDAQQLADQMPSDALTLLPDNASIFPGNEFARKIPPNPTPKTSQHH